jgi:glycosyltransferase involved in cell wall biosynthesis
MPPRVTYWTGTWDPAKEANSKEINALRVESRARAPVVSFAPAQPFRFVRRERVLMLPSRSWPVLRALAMLVEPRGDVTHIFGGQFSWHLFRALGRRPLLLTAVASSGRGERLPHSNIVWVVIETEASRDEWREAGIPPERIQLIRPGIDLNWFRPTSHEPSDRFRLLFASTPSDPAEIEPRGIPLLIELARLRPDIDIVVPWRLWGNIDAARRVLTGLRPPANFLITYGDSEDMRVHHARAHATIVCFARGTGKACPHFVLEGLASGRPCITTADGGLSDVVARAGAGVVAERDVTSLAESTDRLRREWSSYATNARKLAEQQFDVRQFRASYEQLYADIVAQRVEG